MADRTLSINQILMNTLEPEHAMDPIVLKFLNNYIVCWSTSDAAKLASIKTEQGKRILRKPDVQAAIMAIQETLGRKHNFDAREVLERTNEIAQVDPAQAFNPNGTVKSMDEMPPDVRRAIKKLVVREVYEQDANGIRVFTGYIKTVEFWDKMKGIELLGKYEGVFKDQVEHTHEIGKNFADLLLDSERRASERDVSQLKLTKDPYQNEIAIKAQEVKLTNETE